MLLICPSVLGHVEHSIAGAAWGRPRVCACQCRRSTQMTARPRSTRAPPSGAAPSHVIGAVRTCHSTAVRKAGIDLSLEHSAEAVGHRQCTLRTYISLEAKIVSLEQAAATLNDQIGWEAQIGTSRRVFRGDHRATVASIKSGGRVGGRSGRSSGRLGCGSRCGWRRRCLGAQAETARSELPSVRNCFILATSRSTGR
jgi:hypothetical protein